MDHDTTTNQPEDTMTSSIQLNLPFTHQVIALINNHALVVKSGELVTYRVDCNGNCFHGHYFPSTGDILADEGRAMRNLLERTGWADALAQDAAVNG